MLVSFLYLCLFHILFVASAAVGGGTSWFLWCVRCVGVRQMIGPHLQPSVV